MVARGRRGQRVGWRVAERGMSAGGGNLQVWSSEKSELNGWGGEINRGRFMLRLDRSREMEVEELTFSEQIDFRNRVC